MAHLAGALGKPVWTLLHHAADWRWLRGRADSPWYPTMRLFRQEHPGNWLGVIERVRGALHDLVTDRAHGTAMLNMSAHSSSSANTTGAQDQDQPTGHAVLSSPLLPIVQGSHLSSIACTTTPIQL